MSEPRPRKRKTVDPCERCGLHRARCICAQIPLLDLVTRVTLVAHAKEFKRTTNTGRLALQALVNSELCVRGESKQPLDLSHLVNPSYDTFLLYPSDDAQNLRAVMHLRQTQPLSQRRPVHLIVPDGNWRQASKVHVRHPELSQVPRVTLARPDGEPAKVVLGKLRKEHFTEGMATLEAIAYAMGELGEAEASTKLMALYFAKVEATLMGRPRSSAFKSS